MLPKSRNLDKITASISRKAGKHQMTCAVDIHHRLILHLCKFFLIANIIFGVSNPRNDRLQEEREKRDPHRRWGLGEDFCDALEQPVHERWCFSLILFSLTKPGVSLLEDTSSESEKTVERPRTNCI